MHKNTSILIIQSSDHLVYLLRPIPEMDTDVMGTQFMQTKFLGKTIDVTVPLAQYDKRYQFINSVMDEVSKQCGVTLLDPTPYLCEDGKNCLGSKDGRSLYEDSNHLSEYGSSYLRPLFKKVIFKD